eukprot:m.249156 g.249156  ORF g.249156 m.249156 type:complete len:324 (+) comp22621_c0_seq1:3169-4140(+)
MRRSSDLVLGGGSALGPSRSRRSCASADVSPAGDDCTILYTCSQVMDLKSYISASCGSSTVSPSGLSCFTSLSVAMAGVAYATKFNGFFSIIILPTSGLPGNTKIGIMANRYFTPAEVAEHNTETDLWVSFLGKVCDLTKLAAKHTGDPLLKPILVVAGKDISHWFNPETGDVKTHMDPLSGIETAYTPHGRFLHVPPPIPRADWDTSFGTPWWKNEEFVVGTLTKHARKIKILNMLADDLQPLEVCCEETLRDIQERYRRYNTHTDSYTWKFAGQALDMSKTLDANGIPDDSEDLYQLGLDDEDDTCVPELHLYFNDDLTEQ